MAPWSRKSVAEWLRSATRPESMTAYATLAAALAAFLSLKAADRQEKATFTSNLYNKQVETIAIFTEKYSAYLVGVGSFYGEDGDDRGKLYDSLKSDRIAMTNAMITLEFLYPQESESLMEEGYAAERRLWSFIDHAPNGPMSVSATEASEQFQRFFAQLLLCSRQQLREGTNLEGRRFLECAKVPLSRTPEPTRARRP